MRINITEAIKSISQGQVIGVPTETVYGLAASLNNPDAIEKIFLLKNRPRVNPLIIHVADAKDINQYVSSFPPDYNTLSNAFWPGPMTLILPIKTELIPAIVRAGLETAGFRIPSHPLTLQLIKETGPLVMPSANLSGKPSSTQPSHIEEDFGLDFPVLDGGICQNGLESTILYFDSDNKWAIVRLGSLSQEDIAHVLGYVPSIKIESSSNKPLSPGQLFKHYAPKAKLILGNKQNIEESKSSFVLGFKERQYPKDKKVLLLGSIDKPEEVAENLYKMLRQLDQEDAREAWVDMDFPKYGLWQTIAERLQRASQSD